MKQQIDQVLLSEEMDKLKGLPSDLLFEVLAQYNERLNLQSILIKNKQENARQSFMFYQEILNDLSQCLKVENLTFEQRLLLIDKEIEVAKLVDQMVVEMNE